MDTATVRSGWPGWRSKWAAIGAAVAVSLVAGGGFMIADAASGPESSIVTADAVPSSDARTVLLSVTVVAPVDGSIQVVGSTIVDDAGSDSIVGCLLSYGAGSLSDAMDSDKAMSVPASEQGLCSTNGIIEVTAGTHILNLVGRGSDLDFDDTTLDATFTAGGNV